MACLFIGQLPFSKFFDADVYDLLEPYGRVLSVRMQHVKGEAFVYFDSVNSADAAIAALHGRRTLKGRQRPLQLFYASSSVEWSWFGVLHNTRLHHYNPKVELPPFFLRTPPLASTQWTLVPHVTAEATELVLPATLHAMQAAAAAQAEGGSAKSRSSTSSLRTTTSSSSLYSDDSSGDSTQRRPSGRRRAGRLPSTTAASRRHDGAVPLVVDSEERGGHAAVIPLAGTKRMRPHTSPDASGFKMSNAEASVGDDGEEEAKEMTAAAGRAKAPRTSSIAPMTVTAHTSDVEAETDAPSVLQQQQQHHQQRVKAAQRDTVKDEGRGRPRSTRSHRKTKLCIEDEENFAVLADETGDDGAEDTQKSTHKDEGERGVLHLRTPLAQHPTKAARLHRACSGDERRGSACGSSSSTSGTGGSSSSGNRGSTVNVRSAPFLKTVDVAFSDLPNALELSASATTPSTALSSSAEVDVVGATNVLIRRRRAKASGTALSASGCSDVGFAPAPSAQVPGAHAGLARLVRSGILPHHFHHASHTPHGSPSSLSLTPGESVASYTSLPPEPSSSTSLPLPPPPPSHASAAPRRPSRLSTPHHHHHHHRRQGSDTLGAVLSNATLREVQRAAAATHQGAVLGPAEDPHGHSHNASWTRINDAVLRAESSTRQYTTNEETAILPSPSRSTEGGATWMMQTSEQRDQTRNSAKGSAATTAAGQATSALSSVPRFFSRGRGGQNFPQ